MRPGQNGESLSKLVTIMQRLLGPGGCPWDQEQTLKTLTPFVIEEAHEVVDAIEKGSPELLREELGDLLLQIVFQAELARKEGWFGPDDVVDAISEKLIRRHPHVFGDEKVSGSAEVLQQWEILKAKEKKDRGALEGVPASLPALLRAVRVGEKASRFGYDWHDPVGARERFQKSLLSLTRRFGTTTWLQPSASLATFCLRLQALRGRQSWIRKRPFEELSPASALALARQRSARSRGEPRSINLRMLSATRCGKKSNAHRRDAGIDTTSSIESVPSSNMISRSTPRALPAHGGSPISSARTNSSSMG